MSGSSNFQELQNILYESGPIELAVWLDNQKKSYELSGTTNILLEEYKNLDIDVLIKFDWNVNKLVKLKCFSKELTKNCVNASKTIHNMNIQLKIA